MPLTSGQVRPGLDPLRYTIRTVPQLLRKSKAWNDYCDSERSILQAKARLSGTQSLKAA